MQKLPHKPKRILIGLGLGLLAIGLVFASINYAAKLGVGSDYHAFWQAGHDFFHGKDFYQPIAGARAFIYPPFAAFLFQILALAPLNLSANIFFLFNVFVLLPLTFFMLWRICIHWGFDAEKVKMPLGLTLLASLRFFWDNLHMFQVNFLIFNISLAGIYFFSKKQAHLAVICLGIATFIKIYPLFLLLFVLFASWKRKNVIRNAMFTGVACLGIPIILRGYEDTLTYYNTFLKLFVEGRVVTSLTNHTLKSFLFKAFYPEVSGDEILAGCCGSLMTLSNVLLLLLLGMLVFICIRSVQSPDKKHLLFGFAAIFIFTHLISGITWTAHLVSFLFSLLPLFLIQTQSIPTLWEKILYYLLLALAFFLAVEGSDTVGKSLHNALMQYDLFVAFPLTLFGYYSYLLLGQRNTRQIFRAGRS